MFEWKRLLSWHKWNKAFWALFIIIGIILIAGAVAGFLSLVEVLIAFIVIAIGAEKIGEEISDKRLQEEQGKINRDLIFISRWLENNNVFTRQMKDRHELRLLNLDNKRAEIEKRQELGYRELARKIMEVENRLNQLSRDMEKRGIMDRRPGVFQTAKDLGLDLIQRPRITVKPKVIVAPAPVPPRVERRAKPRRTAQKAPPFGTAWRFVVDIAKKRKSIPTLSKKSKDTIVSVGSNSIKVREGRNRKLVILKKGEFHKYWNALARRGVLNFTKDIRGRALIRKGSIIISFLARVPFVEFTLRPRVLHLMPKKTHKPGTLKRRKW